MKVGAREHPDLYDITQMISHLVTGLELEVLDPLHGFLQQGVSKDLVREEFEEGPGAEYAVELANAYEQMKDRRYTEYAKDGYKARERKPSDKYRALHEELNRASAELFLITRRILTARAERFLQGRGASIARQGSGLTQHLGEEAWQEIRAKWNG